MDDELYKKYRPARLGELVGQPKAVEVLASLGKSKKMPHALLLTGPSGCGKTTIARILRDLLHCAGGDYMEINAAASRGIDTVRDQIHPFVGLAGFNGGPRIWCLDECHCLTPDAQSSLLKTLEDTPANVYFFLCTTDPRKLKETIRTRCTEVKVVSLTAKDILTLVLRVAAAENKTLERDIAEKISEHSGGSARKALVLLHQVFQLPTPEKQLAAITAADAETAGFKIAQALLNTSTQWGTLSKLIKECEDDPETIRRIVLAYMSSVLLGKEKEPGRRNRRAFDVLQEFCGHFYDDGKGGLVRAAYAVLEASGPAE